MAAVYITVSLSVVSEVEAYKLFQKKLPNGANVPGVEALGHEREAGGPNNDFGLDFVESIFQWTKKFCEKDSDGDGQTNGQELGDPCCEFEFRKNEKVRWTEGISHPGDPELKADPALWEGIVCGADTEVEAVEPQATEAETAQPMVEKETVVEAAVQHQAGTEEFTAGAPALHASVMLSAAALTVMVIYVVKTIRDMLAFVSVFTLAALAAHASGYSMYAMRVPNGDMVPGVTALGHVDPVLAGPMNEFGMDMIDADFHWTKEFCMKDSDGDGQTNGQELGDPCCEFVFRKNPKVRWTEGISHPGDATLMSDPKLWDGIVCEGTVDTVAEPGNASVNAGEATTEAVKKTAVQGESVEDTEEPNKVSSLKTAGVNDTEEEAVVRNEHFD
ncbi:Hypothetical protein PHPALM_9433 [Phytophthora palmivora]|uniref:Temptin Cys/Cys disulfide domain-containing protein n=1 Tax=Phytophthora palmivora TaxID=4796 RepID=A0A2P4Y7A9_9STRA|nr:Hypothetical protein PHPALM_9433 [Phytophthora palmivora]